MRQDQGWTARDSGDGEKAWVGHREGKLLPEAPTLAGNPDTASNTASARSLLEPSGS